MYKFRCHAQCSRECAILPFREIATYSRCSVCEQTSSGERTMPRRSLLAPDPVNKCRNDESDADSVPFLPRFLLQELVSAHCPHQPRSPFRLPEQIGLVFSEESKAPSATSCSSGPTIDCVELAMGFLPYERPNTALLPSLPAAFWLRNQQQQLSHVGTSKPWKVDTRERRRRARALLIQAALWSPSMNERDINPEAMAE